MTNKFTHKHFTSEAIGWGFIATALIMVSTCSYDYGKKKGRKEVFHNEVSCIQHYTQVHCIEIPYEMIEVDPDA